MATSLNAYNKGSFYYTFTDSVTSSREVANSTPQSSYTYGSGEFKANVGVEVTGLLPSGSGVTFDLTKIEYNVFGLTGVASFSGIKFISVSNNSVINTGIWGTGQNTFSGWDMTVTTTGVNPMSGLFNYGSGNVMVRPHSYFSYNDPYGDLRTSGNHKNIQLNDLGSGSLYRMVILGDLQ